MRRRINHDEALNQVLPRLATRESFGIDDLKTVSGYSKSTVLRLLSKALAEQRIEDMGRRGKMKAYRVIQHPPPLQSTVAEEKSSERRGRLGPVAALKKVIAAHDDGPTRRGLEHALAIIASLSKLAPRS